MSAAITSRSGVAIYFDGETSTRHSVILEIEPSALVVRARNGEVLARWPYGELEQVSAPDGILRLARAGNARLERIEVRDANLAHTIDELSLPIDRTGTRTRRSRRRVFLWSLAATVSLLLVAIYGVPLLAGRIAPLIPMPVERRLGEVVETQVRAMLDPAEQGDNFLCGWKPLERSGDAALHRMVGKLQQVAGLPIPVSISVVRRQEANAIALPGGHIYVFQGLIDQARSADEVAAVIAHEIGHVAHRDGTRSMLQAAGLSFLFGLVLGDFVGGGAVIIAAKTVLQLAYSREVEAAADLYAVEIMEKAGGDPQALAGILSRIAGRIEPGAKFLLDHPETKERVAAILRAAKVRSAASILEPPEWAALRRICAGS